MDGFDSVIVAAGRRPESGLFEEVRGGIAGNAVYTAGSNVPRLAIEAVHGVSLRGGVVCEILERICIVII